MATTDQTSFTEGQLNLFHEFEKESELKEMFRAFDSDNDGYVSNSELRRMVSNLVEEQTDDEIDDTIRKADINEQGKLNFEGFVQVYATI
ncbi:hypothetical protein BDF20DRAFT_846328 [Mycotypha africana]|uniref:uncharacterized protein n=1 Tax=Mycotypha africana TaxID=64632 RepID=UPI002300BE5C|nr:uncharacterized protein BDF20DRAFT_846328 [Mycotypha africana]KAI8991777.1 hypothetical protein BDF20DRAFT_846328 [Mycotypha africana]